MKRILAMAMAMMMLFSTTAFAKTIDGVDVGDSTIFEQNENSKYDVTFEDITNGKEYMLWVVEDIYAKAEDVSFAQEKVLYINQATAANDQVSFENFLPMNIVNSTLVVSGQGMDTPEIVGYIVEGATILLGDVDKNSTVDMDDVVKLLRHVVRAEVIEDTVSLEAGEVVGDAELDMDDVVKLLRFVVKAIDSLE